MYFRQSIRLREELNDRQHLAKVHTAMGQMFFDYQDFVQAVSELSQGFEIDESLSNVRDFKIVARNLADALCKLGRREEALSFCDRALTVDPNNSFFLRLSEEIQTEISTGIEQAAIKTGSILCIERDKKSGLLWGKISPDDESSNIIFNEKYIGSESMSLLIQGALVEVEVEKNMENCLQHRSELLRRKNCEISVKHIGQLNR